MNSTLPEPPTLSQQGSPVACCLSTRRAFFVFAGVVAALAIAFAKPLYNLFQFARSSDVFSYVLLIPFVSAYLIWLKIGRSGSSADPPSESFVARLRWAWVPGVIGLAMLLATWLTRVPADVGLSGYTFAFVAFIAAAGLLTLGLERMRSLAFPFAFLVFVVPFPVAIVNLIETFFQHTSAEAASAMINLSGLPVIRDGLFFRLPGLSLQVAQECSGIRSSLVLFVTSVLAGHMFLRSPWKRLFLAFFVIPLAIVRNGFRIWTLAYLSVEVNPNLIDSPIHHRGGPIFFALSLIPFFLLLLILRKTERGSGSAEPRKTLISTSLSP